MDKFRRGHFVVARSLNRRENGGVDAQAEMGDLFLPNGYGSVLLFDQNDSLVDQVRYEQVEKLGPIVDLVKLWNYLSLQPTIVMEQHGWQLMIIMGKW